jgi:transcriptional regulator with XRE-family HTH domain
VIKIEKSVFTQEYQIFLRHLREARTASGLTQVELGERLGQPQAIISKCERGERRLDVIELRAYCSAMGISYLQFLRKLEQELGKIHDR